LDNVGLRKSVGDYVDGLVHPSAQQDALTATRHRAFIAPRLLGSLVALAALPIYLVARGVPSALEVAVFAWLVAPIAIAFYLSRTGRYEAAHVLSSMALTSLVMVVALATGGIRSFAAIWLVVVPLEASLSASRRVVALASMIALVAAGFLVSVGAAGLLPHPGTLAEEQGALAALGVVSASLYAIGLALGAESLARASVWLLYAEEDRYRLLARNMTDVITRHGRNGAVLFVSPAAEPLFGARASELLGHGLFERVHVADRPAFLTALADAAAQPEGCAVEFRVRRTVTGGQLPEVQFVWVEMRCRPADSVDAAAAGGAPEREVVAVMRDISERKAREAALDAARRESDRAQASKARFLAMMSHELRTPLNAIIGFSEMLANEKDMRIDAARRQEYAKLINESGHHLLSVVNGILDMSKMESGEFEIAPEAFAPVPVIANCCDLLALKAREGGLDLVTRLSDSVPRIVADKRALKQIMFNLVSNAIKFTDRGGCVTVTAKREDASLLLMVEDTGIGIGEDDLPRLGDPFFQARSAYDRRHDGSGLGLSIVKGLVNLHHGEFDLRSELGKGTRIAIRLPLDGEKRPAAEKSSVARPDFKSNVAHEKIPVKKSA
jgi:cell cycle sensor histidine kinase DivJ